VLAAPATVGALPAKRAQLPNLHTLVICKYILDRLGAQDCCDREIAQNSRSTGYDPAFPVIWTSPGELFSIAAPPRSLQ